MKYFLIVLFLTTSLFSSEIKWSNNYHMSRQKAKKENKNILLFISSKDNPFCDYMKEDTFLNDKIIDYINQDYIAVELSIEDRTLPKSIEIFSAPSVYFLNPMGKKIYRRIVGLVTSKQIIFFLEQIRKKKKNQ